MCTGHLRPSTLEAMPVGDPRRPRQPACEVLLDDWRSQAAVGHAAWLRTRLRLSRLTPCGRLWMGSRQFPTDPNKRAVPVKLPSRLHRP